jgi:hypothetical protein
MTSNFEVTVCNFKVTNIRYSIGASFKYAITLKLAATDPVASMPLRSVRLSVTCLEQLLVTEQIAAIGKAVSRHNIMVYDTCPNK